MQKPVMQSIVNKFKSLRSICALNFSRLKSYAANHAAKGGQYIEKYGAQYVAKAGSLRLATLSAVIFAGLAYGMIAHSERLLLKSWFAPSITVPSVLGQKDISLYARAWDLYLEGKFNEGRTLLLDVKNPILMGRLEFLRLMHPTAYRASYKELASFMENYADHADSLRIYKLANRRRGNSKQALVKPYYRVMPDIDYQAFYHDLDIDLLVSRGEAVAEKNPDIALRSGFKVARSLAREARKIRKLVTDGKGKEALSKYYSIAKKGKVSAPEILWWSSVAAFVEGENKEAKNLLSRLAKILTKQNPNNVMLAAVNFWLGRTELRLGHEKLAEEAFKQAAVFRNNYYGVIAATLIGTSDKSDQWHWVNVPKELFANATIKRAIALKEIGRWADADYELKNLLKKGDSNPYKLLALSALAEGMQLPSAALNSATRLYYDHGWYYARGMYPIPWWFNDLELKNEETSLTLLGMARRESRFGATLKSNKGARGVLQVMPATAAFLERKRVSSESKRQLFDANYNVKLASRYFDYLLEPGQTSGNLIEAIASYNAGPRAVSRWSSKIATGDPMQYMETMPYTETRNYVYHVINNIMVYADRITSVGEYAVGEFIAKELAAGEYPTFERNLKTYDFASKATKK